MCQEHWEHCTVKLVSIRRDIRAVIECTLFSKVFLNVYDSVKIHLG